MRKPGYFFRGLLPIIILFIIQVIVAVVVLLVFTFKGQTGIGNPSQIFEAITGVARSSQYLQVTNITFGIVSLIVMGLWYLRRFVRPARGKIRKIPGGFSIHTVLSLIILAFGLQLLGAFIVEGYGQYLPDLYEKYNSLMTHAGFDGSSLWILTVVYSVLVAPFAEEFAFRGLTYRFARGALPFWLANIWQALLFGILHANLIQGTYAFVIGLFLGYIAHRGRGIKYSILCHILVNLCAFAAPGLISILTDTHRIPGMAITAGLIVFGLWIFTTDFIPAQENAPEMYYE